MKYIGHERNINKVNLIKSFCSYNNKNMNIEETI